MEVTIENVSSVKKIFHIEIPEKEVTKELDVAYKDLKKNAKVKGFRPGKAPRSVLERLYKKDVHADVLSKLIQNSLIEAFQEHDLNIVGEPSIDPPSLEPGSSYKYDAAVEIRPEIEPVDFKGLALTKTKYVASDGEVDAQLEMLRQNASTQKDVEDKRPAKEGDFVLLDYEGFQDGKPFDAVPKNEDASMKIGMGRIHKTFDEQLVGMSLEDEKEFDVVFPEDYHDEKLIGKTVTYKVKMKGIRELIVPELSDDLAKKFGPYETLDDLKKEILKNLKEGYEKRIEQELNEQIFSQLIEKTDFEIPDVMVQYELDGILEEAERAFAQSNLTLDQMGMTRESLSEKYRETAEKQVRRHLILGSMIEHEKLIVSDEELDAGFEDLAKNFNQPVEGIKSFYDENPDKIDFFKHTLLEKKAIKLIIDNSQITEVEPEVEKEQDEESPSDEGKE